MKIPRDKWKHFFVAIPLGIGLQLLSEYFILSDKIAVMCALVSLFIICYAFELFSKLTGIGHYEIADIIAGVAGGSIGIVLIIYII